MLDWLRAIRRRPHHDDEDDDVLEVRRRQEAQKRQFDAWDDTMREVDRVQRQVSGVVRVRHDR